MNNSLTMEPTAAEAEEFKIFLQQGLVEMDRLFALMAEDQKEIDRRAARTAVTLSEIRAMAKQSDAILATLRFS
jgi:hypothetical protein